jgi:hypothetical protein
MVLQGQGGRNAYNIEVQKTNAEEMLLNLVRLRYYDSPFFLEVSSITSQFTFKNSASASINIPGFNQTNPMNLGGETLWQNQPTIQYSPLEGQEFARKLMQPLDVSILQQVIYSGWEIDRVFLLTVQALDDFRNLSKEGCVRLELNKYEVFSDLVHLFRQLQLQGNLQTGITNGQNNDDNGKKFQFSFPAEDPYSKKIAEILKKPEPKSDKYIINVIEGFDEKGNIGILPRSLLSCMYYLAHSVMVPQKDILEDKAINYSYPEYKKEEVEKLYKELLVVHNSENKPKDSYIAIKYRDTWFYIKDNDLNSKKTFMLLLELYNLQSGKRISQGPILTLPIGG